MRRLLKAWYGVEDVDTGCADHRFGQQHAGDTTGMRIARTGVRAASEGRMGVRFTVETDRVGVSDDSGVVVGAAAAETKPLSGGDGHDRQGAEE
ncbi:MAG: hypothetical protein JJT81_03345 [Rubellimicrobium sp.]|nr:hypothetical protein [Rubellimicrobium sp.]